jgi:NADPH-dependent 2,4-dienoyl-CoA reductase/sulfur reductase-like enzyme
VTAERLVVVGGDAAGMSAAAQACRRRKGEEFEVITFERGEYTSYSACGIPYFVADEIGSVDELVARTPDEHRASGIDVRTRHEVVAVDASARTVTARDLDSGREYEESFDQLVFATGSTPVRPDIPNVDAPGVHSVQTLTDGIALRDHVAQHTYAGQHAVIIGGGYIGLELGEALHRRGLPVTVVEANVQPLSKLDPDMGARVAIAMRRIGLDVRTETRVEGFEVDERGHVRAVVTSEGTLPADVVVLGIGVEPNVELARAAGIAIGDEGGITTDPRMATNVDGIWAAGDCVETRHRITGRQVTIALGTHANKQGRIAGINATGGDERFGGVIGTAVTKICEYEIGRTGLSEEEAQEEGFEYVTATIESTTRAGYFPGAQSIAVKMLVERGTRRLVGAQIIGREGAAKRIDALAVALWAEMTVDDVIQLDLGYAPPFSPVWDPVLVAARVAASELD